MAQSPAGAGVGKLNFLSLTGPLNLYQKGLFKGQYKKYWFWFDEQTCHLKYYKSQQTYSQSVREPLGVIDLRYAKVTPALSAAGSSGTKASNVFHINVENQMYVLAAENNESAINWIEKLQEKRSEFIKATSAQLEANQEQEKRRTLSMFTKPVGALASGENTQVEDESPTVRKIFTSRLQGDTLGSLGMTHSDSVKQTGGGLKTDSNRRSTVSTPIASTALDLNNAESTPTMPVGQSLTLVGDDSSEQPALQPHERAQLALEACYLESQNKAFKLQREVLHLKEQLQCRDKEILELNKEIANLKEELAMRKTPRSDMQMENENLKNIIEQYKRSVKSLDDEIELHKLNQGAHGKIVQAERLKSAELEREMNFIKSKYVKLLSEQFKITVPGSGVSRAGEERDLTNQNKYHRDLLDLLKHEGGENSVFETYSTTFEDNYGDRYEWEGDTATQHYLCRLLYTHYRHHEQDKLHLEWEEYLSQLKPAKGGKDLVQLSTDRNKLRTLLRKGLPLDMRGHVWSSLVHQNVGRLKEVRDRATAGGETYYQSLLRKAYSSSAMKQIRLDLYRTLPSNRHFKSGGAGAEKLERILLAYSLHNDKISYCQGMNMIAAFGLFYLDEETSFWFLVMIIEKLMPFGYYTPGLLGAQADLAVVKRLVAEKLPRINAHLQEYFIDVTLVTFNWFLTIFIDALPTESALRIMDCFLLEGHKILFRVALAILKVNEQHILSLSDPVGLFQFLKEVARHTFDVEELFNAAFVQLNPFPRRGQLASWHHAGFLVAKEQWNKRERQRLESEKQEQQQQTLSLLTSISASPEVAPTVRHLHWECGCVRGTREAWLCCDEKGQGRLGVVSLDDNTKPHLQITSCKVNPRIITLYHDPSTDLLFVGTLDFVLQVIDCKSREVIWSHKFKDSILDIVGTSSGKIIVGLANGNISMFEHVSKTSLDDDPAQLHIGSGSVNALVVSTDDIVWCGAGKTIMVVSTDSFEPVHSFLVSGKVNKMREGPHGIWVSFRSSTTVSLYDSMACVKLLEIDYTSLCPSQLLTTSKEEGTISNLRVTSILADGDIVYIGTGGGELFQFRAIASVADPEASIKALVAERGKPRSRRRREGNDGGATVRGGLLSKPAVVGPEKESQPPDDSHSSYYAIRNRRTQFGRTLRRGKPDGEYSGHSLISVYQLEFLAHKKLGSAVNEPVRVILPFEQRTLVCVNRVLEWDKCVALLKSRERVEASDSEEWLLEYVPSPRQQQRVSLTAPPDQALTVETSAL